MLDERNAIQLFPRPTKTDVRAVNQHEERSCRVVPERIRSEDKDVLIVKCRTTDGFVLSRGQEHVAGKQVDAGRTTDGDIVGDVMDGIETCVTGSKVVKIEDGGECAICGRAKSEVRITEFNGLSVFPGIDSGRAAACDVVEGGNPQSRCDSSQRVPPVLLRINAEGHSSVDGTYLVFKVPIASQKSVSRIVRAGGDICVGQLAQRFQQVPPPVTACQVAPVKYQIRISGEGIAPPGNLVGIGIEIGVPKPGVPQLDRAAGPMGHEMNGVDIFGLGQCRADLFHAVLPAV